MSRVLLLLALVVGAAHAADPGTQPVSVPADWYTCKLSVTNDCERVGSEAMDLDERDAAVFTKLVIVAFAPAKGSRAQLIETLGYTPEFERVLPTGVRQYAWQHVDAQRVVVAGITVLTQNDRVISINLLRFNRYNLQWSPKHPSPPLAALEESSARHGAITLKRLKLPGAAGGVRIGFGGTFTPPQFAVISTDLERGARLAVEEINARGGVLAGGRRLPIELWEADDKRDPAEARRAAEALVSAGVVAVIGHTFTSTSRPASAVYAKGNVPVINAFVSNTLLYEDPLSKTTFRTIANDDQVLETLLRYADQELRARAVSIVYEYGAYGERFARMFIAMNKGTVASYDVILPKPGALAEVVKTIVDKQPDAVFYAGNEQTGGKLLAELAQAGSSVPVIANDGACTAQVAALAGNGARLLTCGIAGEAVENLPLGWRLSSRILRRFDVRNTAVSAYAYDAVYVIAAAIERAGSLDMAAITEALRATDYDGFTGPIAFDVSGELVRGAVSFYNLEDGTLKWVRSVR